MKIQRVRLLIPFIALMVAILFWNMPGYASEAGNGGQVTPEAIITFYDESTSSTTDTSTTDTSNTDTSTPDTNTTEPTDTKPTISQPGGSTDTLPSTAKPTGDGKYPSTGEIVKMGLSISGIVLFGITGIVLFSKNKKKEAGDK